MKKKLTGFALLSSLFLLTACNATNTGGSGSGDGTAKSEQVSGDSSETEEVSYDELYASVLDLYRPIALNGDTSAVPSDLSSDEAYATSTIFDAKRAGENVQYSYVDINDDGSAELLIGTPDSVHALYYLDNDDKPVFAISAGTFAKGGYLNTLHFYKNGIIYCQLFHRMKPEAKAETYEIKDGVFNQLQSVDFSMSETTDGASKVGLGNEQTLDLSSEVWYDFDDSSSDETEASSSDSKSNKETGMDINAIQNGDFSSIAGTWKNGKGYTMTFDKNGLVSDTERVDIENSKVTDGYLKSSTGPKSGVGVGGGAIAFLPKGVSLTGSVMSSSETADDQSDKTKERLWMGQQLNGTTDDSYFFYKVD
ncbi:DUF6287 domain-containing protein [Streptococcus salivarius]|jgi:hypothetical protein|uniref:DUF6287 domain-containing protein n=1 Tax=Streptococcus salivarius TaxID=1304 RepID=UPI0009B75038|nr:DUF6287 domain-containing protein [Streptococcus salivarius]